MTCPRSRSKEATQLAFEPKPFNSRAYRSELHIFLTLYHLEQSGEEKVRERKVRKEMKSVQKIQNMDTKRKPIVPGEQHREQHRNGPGCAMD